MYVGFMTFGSIVQWMIESFNQLIGYENRCAGLVNDM